MWELGRHRHVEMVLDCAGSGSSGGFVDLWALKSRGQRIDCNEFSELLDHVILEAELEST